MKKLPILLMVATLGCSDSSSQIPKVTDQGTRGGSQQDTVPPPASAESKEDKAIVS